MKAEQVCKLQENLAKEAIALELGLSRSTVKRALDDLCRAGLLQKDPRWRENGSLTSNLYHVV